MFGIQDTPCDDEDDGELLEMADDEALNNFLGLMSSDEKPGEEEEEVCCIY